MEEEVTPYGNTLISVLEDRNRAVQLIQRASSIEECLTSSNQLVREITKKILELNKESK